MYSAASWRLSQITSMCVPAATTRPTRLGIGPGPSAKLRGKFSAHGSLTTACTPVAMSPWEIGRDSDYRLFRLEQVMRLRAVPRLIEPSVSGLQGEASVTVRRAAVFLSILLDKLPMMRLTRRLQDVGACAS